MEELSSLVENYRRLNREIISKLKRIKDGSVDIEDAREIYRKIQFIPKKNFEERLELLVKVRGFIERFEEGKKKPLLFEDLFPLEKLKDVINDSKKLYSRMNKKKYPISKTLENYYKELLDIDKEINEENKDKYKEVIYFLNDKIHYAWRKGG